MGLLVTLPIAMLDPAPWLLFALLVLVLGTYSVVKEPLWVNAALSTVLIVIATDPAAGGVAAGETRLLAVFTAGVLVVLGGALLAWWGRRHPGWFDEEIRFGGLPQAATPDRSTG